MNAEPRERHSGTRLWLARLGSLKLTLVILLLTLAGGAMALVDVEHMTRYVALPFALFALNLACSLLTYPSIRRQKALLVFHLALLAILLLVALSRLTYLKGSLEVTEGAVFGGQLVSVEAGPWHRWRLDRAGFENLGYSTLYVRGTKRISTLNHVRWTDEAGRQQEAMIGDLEPLKLHGYRFYPDFSHQGFSVVFVWLPTKGLPTSGSVHLPAYPAAKTQQQQELTLPGSKQVLSITLQFDEVILDPTRVSEFRLPKQHSMLVRMGSEQHTLVPGGRLELAGGTLVYEGLRRWMGYNAHYDFSILWLLGASVVAVLSLSWHFWRKFAAQPWLEPDKES